MALLINYLCHRLQWTSSLLTFFVVFCEWAGRSYSGSSFKVTKWWNSSLKEHLYMFCFLYFPLDKNKIHMSHIPVCVCVWTACHGVCVWSTWCVLFNQWRLNGWLVMWQIGYLIAPQYFTQYLHELGRVYRDREQLTGSSVCVCVRPRGRRPTVNHYMKDYI